MGCRRVIQAPWQEQVWKRGHRVEGTAIPRTAVHVLERGAGGGQCSRLLSFRPWASGKHPPPANARGREAQVTQMAGPRCLTHPTMPSLRPAAGLGEASLCPGLLRLDRTPHECHRRRASGAGGLGSSFFVSKAGWLHDLVHVTPLPMHSPPTPGFHPLLST